MIPKRRTYLPEDIEDHGGGFSINKCTFEVQSDDNHGPDYNKFELLYYIRNLQLQLLRSRLSNERPPEDDDEKVMEPLTTELSEDNLKQMFVQRFGTVDFSDPLMVKRLEVMKNSLAEMATQPLDERKVIEQLWDINFQGAEDEDDLWYDDPDIAEDFVQSKTFNTFSKKEIRMFSSLNPAHVGSDWFQLPRGDLSKIREAQFPDYSPKDKTVDEQIRSGGTAIRSDGNGLPDGKISKRPLSHLHVYDPKFEFTQPQHIIFTSDEGLLTKEDASKILNHLNSFPNGITRKMFWRTLDSKHHLKIPQDTKSKVFDFLLGEVLVVPGRGSFPELIFPGFLEGVVDPQLTLNRLCHDIRCLVARKPSLIGDPKLMNHIKNEFGFKFDPSHWGFEYAFPFLSWCREVFGLQYILPTHLIELLEDLKNQPKSFQDCFPWPLQLRFQSKKETNPNPVVDTKTNNKQKRREKPDPIPKGCAGENFKMTFTADYISSGEIRTMDLIATYDPSQLNFVLGEYRNVVDSFQEAIQISPLIRDIQCFPPPRNSQLKIGMYVMVRLKWTGKEEYYRARIIRKNSEKAEYYVFGIDAGFFRNVGLDTIRFMPVSIAKEMAYAVPTQLTLAKGEEYKWEQDGNPSKLVDEPLASFTLQVQFEEGGFNSSLGCTKWSINSSLIEKICYQLYSVPAATPAIFSKILTDVKHRILDEKIQKIFEFACRGFSF